MAKEYPPIVLGTEVGDDAVGPIMTVTHAHVDVDLNMKTTQHIYKAQGKRGGRDIYGLSKPLLENLQDAANIQIVSSEAATMINTSHVVWQVVAMQQLPDSTKKRIVKTYELDLRVPHRFEPDMAEFQPGAGGRYSELHAKYYWDEVQAALKELKIKLPNYRHDTKVRFTIKAEMAMAEKDEGWHRMARLVADRRAKATISGMAAHILSRAESGATMRMLRSCLGLAQTYTLDELRGGFDVVRAQQNLELLDSLVPDARVRARLLLGKAADLLNLRLDTVTALLPEAQQPDEPEIVDADEPADEPKDGVIIVPPPSEDDVPLPEDVIMDLEPELPPDDLDPAEPARTVDMSVAIQGLVDALGDAKDDEQPDGPVQFKAQNLAEGLGIAPKLPMTAAQMRDLIATAKAGEESSE